MLTLVCVVVGEGRPFSVEIEPEKIVDALKKKIKREKEYQFPADKLELYLALKDGAWIGSKSSIVREMRKGVVGDTVKELIQEDMELDPADTIGACFVGELKPEIGTKQIHVLVVVPVVQAHYAMPSYFMLPETRDKVANAVFMILDKDIDEEYKRIGIGVFFSATLAVTCDHNLTEKYTVGSHVSLALKNNSIDSVEVVARNSELDFAILKAFQPRSFIAPWNGSPDDLELRYDLVLASFRLGIDDYQAPYRSKLGFAPAACIAISRKKRHIMYSCPTYAGDSGAALIVKDGFLVGIHLETINALREEIERKKVIKDRLNDVEQSLDMIVRSGLAQGCSGLLVHEFKNVVSE